MKLRSEIPELNGATKWLNSKVTKNDLIGEKPTLVHFWSMRCNLCKEAMPKINKYRDVYKDRLNVISVHTPRSEKDLNINEIIQVAEEHDISQPIFIDNEMKLTDVFENEYVPAYYLFDREGKLRHFQAGGSSMKTLFKRVERILNEG
ncbi:redoxin domain-containing protein [Pueribacillus sp. YX66]|uniref:redoxin domain-containing protein n=1 Tax=Pueribacillus sp. YX66 TaxID=3229242 RepID=UPI00358D5869